MRLVPVFLMIWMLAACGDSSSEQGGFAPTDTAGLLAALESAQPGDVVSLGGGEFEGQFHVPAGVVVDGQGAVIRGLGPAAFRLDGGDLPTTLRELHVVNDGVGSSVRVARS